MKPIELNFSSQPYRNDTPLIVGLLLLALTAFGLTGYNTHAYLTADTRLATLEDELAGHQMRKTQMQDESTQIETALTEIDQETLAYQADFVSSILSQRNFSWTSLFNELERVLRWNTRVTSVRPEFQAGQVVINLQGLSQTSKAYFDFQNDLLESERFIDVVPGNFEILPGSDQIRFQLECIYVPRPTEPEESMAESDEAAETIVVSSEAAGSKTNETLSATTTAGGSSAPANEATSPRARRAARRQPASTPQNTTTTEGGANPRQPNANVNNATPSPRRSSSRSSNASSDDPRSNRSTRVVGGGGRGVAPAAGGATNDAVQAAADAALEAAGVDPNARNQGVVNRGSANRQAENSRLREAAKEDQRQETVTYDEQGNPQIKLRTPPAGQKPPANPNSGSGDQGGDDGDSGSGDSGSGGGQ